MIMLYIIKGVTLGFSAAVSPGPFQAYLLSQTMKNGWQRTLPATLAPILTDGPIIALMLLILTQTPTWFLNMLQVLGGGFILFLARNAYLTFKRTETTSDLVPDSAAQSFFKAAVINILNPNPYIFWSVISGPILLDGWRESPIFGIGFITSFYGMFIGCLVVLVLLFGIARSSGPVVVRVLIGISALALLVFGVYQIISGVMGFVG